MTCSCQAYLPHQARLLALGWACVDKKCIGKTAGDPTRPCSCPASWVSHLVTVGALGHLPEAEAGAMLPFRQHFGCACGCRVPTVCSEPCAPGHRTAQIQIPAL